MENNEYSIYSNLILPNFSSFHSAFHSSLYFALFSALYSLYNIVSSKPHRLLYYNL